MYVSHTVHEQEKGGRGRGNSSNQVFLSNQVVLHVRVYTLFPLSSTLNTFGKRYGP